MPLQCAISSATPQDFPRMAEVWELAVRETQWFLRELDIQVFRALIGGYFHKAEALACMRDGAGEAVAFCGVSGGNLEMLFVHPHYRGIGIGRRLVEHVTGTLGVTSVDVNEQNYQALGFYLRMGFEVVRRSEVDSIGKPFPLLHMRLRVSGSVPGFGAKIRRR